MIAAWMLWSAGIGLLFFVAGLATERLLTLGGRQTRWVWLTAGVATVVLPGLRLLGRSPGQEVAPPAVAPVLLEPLAVTVSSDSILRSFDDLLVLGWAVLSSLLMVTVLLAFARLVREGKSWEPGSLGNRFVLWSPATGPTVVGLLRPRVVLPAWVRATNSSEQELILAHEEEHIRAGDARLRFLMTLPLFAFPWNPALWLQRHRLSLAIELDCDRRVMQRMPSQRRTYGDLLLRVGAGRNGLHRLAIVSLAEGRSQLERRIRGLVERVPRARRVQGVVLLLGAAAIVALAVVFPRIRGEGETAGDRLADIMDAPTPTPFTEPPDLLNEREVQLALEREYPPTLKEAGIGGTGIVQVLIDAEGEVQRVILSNPTGHEGLDDAVLRVARLMRFSSGRDQGEPVPVWIAVPISFGNRVPAGYGISTIDEPALGEPSEPPDADAQAEFPDQDTRARPDSGARQEVSLADAPTFTPLTVRPHLVNEEEARQALEEEYPPMLREAGIGGTVNVHFFIDTEGEVQRVLGAQTSGHEALDSAALRAARVFRFTPALNLDERVPVWIAIPLTFQPDDAGDEQPDAPAPPEDPAGADTLAAASGTERDYEALRRVVRTLMDARAIANDPERVEALRRAFTPFEERPDLLNEEEVQQALADEYPPLLREAGVGGTINVQIFIDAEGEVQNAVVGQSSGHEALDEAGLRVARSVRFTPARNQGEIVPVWIAIPIMFTPDEYSLEAAPE